VTYSSSGCLAEVSPGSPAERAGLRPGDKVIAINGHVLHDVIDYWFYGADEGLEILIQRDRGGVLTLEMERDYGEALGLRFGTPVFDGIRRCCNQCEFCFINQMPPGLRQALYVKDDDYRYSFLFGNFVTLTNLDDRDWERLAKQRLSPLYVSVHATDPTLRARILGVEAAPEVLGQIQRLASLGIKVHAQIVVVPRLNDGTALDATVRDLATLHPAVASIAVVPVGLTRYHTGGLRTMTVREAEQITHRVEQLQRGYRQRLGVGLVHCADEFYLMADRRVPTTEEYDGYPQLANGVGLTRQLLDDWEQAKGQSALTTWRLDRVTLVCGELIAPTMQDLAAELADRLGTTIEVVVIANHFFGTSVTVSGLLAAEDVLSALDGMDVGDLLILPRAMFDARGEVTLDGRVLADIRERVGTPIVVGSRLSEVLRL
jgi:putative radical SAM enzyme (TIGR03279 family)